MPAYKTIYIVVGTRPNFIKITQFKRVSEIHHITVKIIHTGQHYDSKMADVFFEQFKMQPDHFLDVKARTPNQQIAEIMIRLEELCSKIGKPDLLLVPGDVNSTLAAALFANKNSIPLGHIESGLRSFDRTMPEEFNRILTDELSDYFFVTEPSGKRHLIKEGKDPTKIFMVGNTMIDTMVAFEKEIEASDILDQLALGSKKFVLMTMHRPATVDNKEGLEKLIQLIDYISGSYKVVFPIHPRTLKMAKEFGLHAQLENNQSLITTEPLDYFAFQKLIKDCEFIITDSGGIQEESTYRQKPCLTVRPNTERPITIDEGTNTLLPFDLSALTTYIDQISAHSYKKGRIPDLWDGNATERILAVLAAS